MYLFVQALMKACQAAVLSQETRRELQVVFLYHQVVTSEETQETSEVVTLEETQETSEVVTLEETQETSEVVTSV
jgi:hypothetical protein